MTKNEFLEQLQRALSGEVPQDEIINQIKFYEEYIRNNSKNKSEDLIILELGSPRLIAKTIIDSYERTYGSMYKEMNKKSYQEEQGSFDRTEFHKKGSDKKEYSRDFRQNNPSNNIYNFPWLIKAISMLILIIVIFLIIIIGGIILRLFFSIGIPILIIIMLIYFLKNNK